ncbi:MAG: nucleoside 2-deoxyribosyltransferase [Nitrospira sp.]|nr:nucleoside 2-deoxyribosyltransferase [Nitrospira sp.]
MKMYLSSPAYNNPQLTGHVTIQQAAEEAGVELLNPNAIQVVNDDGSPRLTPHELFKARVEMLDSADIIFCWLDQLLLADHKLYLLTDVKEKIPIPLPTNIIQYTAIGMQAMGHAQVQPKRGIITPNDPDKGMEVTNVPRELVLTLQGRIFAQVVKGPINIPDTTVMFEMGYAYCRGKPVVSLGIAWPQCGLMACASNVFITEFDGLSETLKELRESLGRGIEEFASTATRVQGEYQKKTAKRLEELRERARREQEDDALEDKERKIISPDFGRK